MKIKGVTGVHHIHVWALSTQVNALTAHLVVNESITAVDEQHLKENVKHELLHFNIQHATLETEKSNLPCTEEEC
jgi:cobalt-zinc-cadmium efflux system protein